MVTFTPTPTDLNDLDHHLVYTWRIDNINLNGGTISSASLTFTNIANWDSNANVLHLWLLDTARNAGVSSFVDDPTNAVPETDMTDDFLSTRFHSSAGLAGRQRHGANIPGRQELHYYAEHLHA